ncbi:RdgB/HAM1 family non-canonical purine NTP pyrophosphatase [Aestuariibius insulae]|uniref:RdgB/HAM1 family non-canonical purine NTP pyrophosphatase n=1 Tax=Aestuariibius insulae TaxID=2058287 RepID=UPI00345EC2EF
MRRFDGKRLLMATHNAGKLEEMAALLNPYGVKLSSNADDGLPEPDETEDTFLGNALIKAQAAVNATGLPALADDSGIEIDGLDGQPGVYTADWAETPHGRDFVVAMTKAWDMLEARDAPAPRTARFCCTLVLAWPDDHFASFDGRMEGQIVWPMRGDQGHGYDAIFMPDGYDITFGEMDLSEKNRISHRAIAVQKMIEGCFAR